MLNSSILNKKEFFKRLSNNKVCLNSFELFIKQFLKYKEINETLSKDDKALSGNRDTFLHVYEQNSYNTILSFKEDKRTTFIRVADDKIYFIREYDKNEMTTWFKIELKIDPQTILQFELNFDKENNIAIKYLNSGLEKNICELFVSELINNGIKNESFESLEIFYDFTFSNIEKNKIMDSCDFLKKLIKNNTTKINSKYKKGSTT